MSVIGTGPTSPQKFYTIKDNLVNKTDTKKNIAISSIAKTIIAKPQPHLTSVELRDILDKFKSVNKKRVFGRFLNFLHLIWYQKTIKSLEATIANREVLEGLSSDKLTTQFSVLKSVVEVIQKKRNERLCELEKSFKPGVDNLDLVRSERTIRFEEVRKISAIEGRLKQWGEVEVKNEDLLQILELNGAEFDNSLNNLDQTIASRKENKELLKGLQGNEDLEVINQEIADAVKKMRSTRFSAFSDLSGTELKDAIAIEKSLRVTETNRSTKLEGVLAKIEGVGIGKDFLLSRFKCLIELMPDKKFEIQFNDLDTRVQTGMDICALKSDRLTTKIDAFKSPVEAVQQARDERLAQLEQAFNRGEDCSSAVKIEQTACKEEVLEINAISDRYTEIHKLLSPLSQITDEACFNASLEDDDFVAAADALALEYIQKLPLNEASKLSLDVSLIQSRAEISKAVEVRKRALHHINLCREALNSLDSIDSFKARIRAEIDSKTIDEAFESDLQKELSSKIVQVGLEHDDSVRKTQTMHVEGAIDLQDQLNELDTAAAKWRESAPINSLNFLVKKRSSLIDKIEKGFDTHPGYETIKAHIKEFKQLYPQVLDALDGNNQNVDVVALKQDFENVLNHINIWLLTDAPKQLIKNFIDADDSAKITMSGKNGIIGRFGSQIEYLDSESVKKIDQFFLSRILSYCTNLKEIGLDNNSLKTCTLPVSLESLLLKGNVNVTDQALRLAGIEKCVALRELKASSTTLTFNNIELPESIEVLDLQFCENVTNLKNILSLCPNLREFHFGVFNKYYSITNVCFPSSLEILTLRGNYDCKNLSRSIQGCSQLREITLEFSNYFVNIDDLTVPASVNKMVISHHGFLDEDAIKRLQDRLKNRVELVFIP